jgi:ribosomal protein S18 acetylase RimI-like enzyme
VTSRLVPLDPGRFGEALALVGSDARSRELLARAEAGSREAIAVGAVDETGALCGFAIHGEVAGATGTSALLYIIVRPDARRTGVGRALVLHVVGEARARGARLVVAELPGAVRSAAALGLLGACGFRREGEVVDFYRDGVPLLLLGCRLE